MLVAAEKAAGYNFSGSLIQVLMGMRKKICVIDGQGGGIGSAIIKKLKAAFGESVEILALGTNAIATAQMLKAQANRGATGENAIVRTVQQADIILGALSVVLAHAMVDPLPHLVDALVEHHLKGLLAKSADA